MTVEEANEVIDDMIAVMRNPDFSDALNQVQDGLIAQTERSFGESVDPDGEAWDPVQYRTSGGPPLVLTGALAASAVDEASSATVTDNSLTTDGTRLMEYAANMNYEEYFSSPKYVGWVAFYPPYPTVVKDYIKWHPAREFIGFGVDLVNKSVDYGFESLKRQIVRDYF